LADQGTHGQERENPHESSPSPARAQKGRQEGRKEGGTFPSREPSSAQCRQGGRAASVSIAFAQTTSLPGVTDRRIEAVIALIENGLATGVNVSKLGASVGLSRFRLEHLFKAQVGTPIRVYVEAMRVAKAKALLPDLRLRVKEVAARCGYASSSSLTREFERKLGLSPSEYRHSTPG
jgi:transcriptional regulator GlxA family with amidase domain